MADQNSILDKIIESQERQQAASFNPNELIASLLKNISAKESDILSRRFGLLGKKKETLEDIGKYYEITRERIRQIETATIKKLRDLKDFRQQLDLAKHHVGNLLENYGGVMEENFLLNEIGSHKSNQENYAAALFILNHLLNDRIESVKADPELLNGWKLPSASLDLIKQVVKELVNVIKKEEKLLKAEELIDGFKQSDFYANHKEQIAALKLGASEETLEQEIDRIIDSYLKISRQTDQNILGEWGLSHWHTVSPKRMSDKIYLVLRKLGKPIHFTEITDLINQSKFDKKVAYPATIHNELILDDRYVLVGRGIYALKEWGYQTGTVMDIIVDILKKANKPLTKEEIIEAVLAQRLVRKSTIYLALTNKDKIKKLPDNGYTLIDR
ncbi:MAG: hypothetical protein A2663_00210 [Candidatus Buchananbacteria bacterium RIFCSPHIGHO2_01_FULL_46_12]|uniref:HTH HARE-type domain-containing protein n=2 Tax=Candidatus Buchananiibacteriota TaxID=1817903 RepID=A0A1G1Y266_9BACT|nr:MAG: hypothetical protein A2663_00210 [Candidatus Buchananbacteria bacterium RIFCSPHIGHO2_01_FULL_46_12]OGY56297.1 MAG: hypothetical protein A3H67_02665 [Candidatus Buchananbacteria bacterium RIFCSPLOWO2_02_FULL_46_11b]